MTELIRPIETRRLYQIVADRIRAVILSGQFQPGSRLPGERELAQMLGVSRPSLREALIALEIDGSVEVRMGSGIYVTAPRSGTEGVDAVLGDSPSEIMQTRMILEGGGVVLACARLAKTDLDALQTLLGSMRDTIEAGQVPLQQDREFHVLLASLSGNSVVSRLVGSLFDERKGAILVRLSREFESGLTWSAALSEHEAIVAGLEAGDPLRAQAAMRHHLQCSTERWLGS